MGLIHAKINWALVGPNIHDIFFKNDLSEVHNFHLGFLTLFCDTCDIFCIHYCALILFHDSALLLDAKVRSHSHFANSHA